MSLVRQSLAVLLFSLSTIGAIAAPAKDASSSSRERLLEQLRYGETIHRDDLVEDALQRLLRLDPTAQEALVAQVYLATRRGDLQTAQQTLQTLSKVAPGSAAYAQAQALIDLTSDEAQKQLAQARLYAAVGRVADARQAYEALFKGSYPTADLAVEYWRLRGREPSDRQAAHQALRALHAQYPRHPDILTVLANYSFDANQPQQGLAYLHELAKNSKHIDVAAAREFEYLSSLPISEASSALWAGFVDRYAGTRFAADAQSTLKSQQALLADPVWRAGQQGIVMVEAGQGKEALAQLQAAVKAYPTDPQLLGTLGLAYLRSNDREQALKYFNLAKTHEPRVDSASRWVSLIESTKHWTLLNQASQALARAQWSQAQRLYQEALQQDPGNVFALVGLGDAALGLRQSDQAWQYYRQAFDREPENSTAQNGMRNFLRTLTPAQALQRLNQFPATQQRYLVDLKRAIRLTDLEAQALNAQDKGHWSVAAELLTQAQALNLDDPWISYQLANSLRMAGQTQEGLAAYQRHLQRNAQHPTSVYAYALLLESLDQWQAGIDALNTISETRWNTDMVALKQRLQSRQLITKAQTLYDQGQVDAAMTLLEAQPQSTPLELQLAEWSLQQNHLNKALQTYQKILTQDPNNLDAQLGALEVRVAQGELAQVRQQLIDSPPDIPDNESSARRRLALLWAAVGEAGQASAIFETLVASGGRQDPLIHRDYARLVAQQNPKQALALYQQAMQVAGMLPAENTADEPIDEARFTQAMRTPDVAQDWLQSSLRNDASNLYQKNNPSVTLSTDSWFRNDGTPGVSQLNATNVMLQINQPIAGGNGFLRADYMTLRAGSFETDASGNITEQFGTCRLSGQTASGLNVALPGCRNVPSQNASGTALALGWQNDQWGFDIGRTPSSFPISNWVGGAHVQGDFGDMGWRLTASRRPISSSLLSLAGATDPRTGTVWGGVLATGGALGLSWDQGQENGVWANISYHRLTGTNVADNSRFRLMGGYYRRLINKPNELMTVGVNAMYWRYAKNLSQYTLGQGGYYSPQMYASISLPVSYARRYDDWSFSLQGSVSLSRTRTDNQTYYPLMGAMAGPVNDMLALGATPASLSSANMNTGSSGTSFGYYFRGALERRINNHWLIGGAVEIQRSQDHSPNRVMLYLRYFFNPWQGDLQLQPTGLVPYVDFN